VATLARLDIELRANTLAVTQGLTKVSRSLDSLHGLVFKLAGAFGLAFGIRGIVGAVTGSIRAFAEQEEATQTLRAALMTTGKDGAASLDLLTESAQNLQKVTTKGDEAIIQATASLASLATQLDARQLAQAQSAIIGIADTFLKGDIASAALLVGKSIGSSKNALRSYGIALDTSASQQEKLAVIVRASAGFFEVSKARAETLTGQMFRLANAWGDFREVVGAAIAAGGLGNFLGKVREAIESMTAILEAAPSRLVPLMAELGGLMGGTLAEAIIVAVAKVPAIIAQLIAHWPAFLGSDRAQASLAKVMAEMGGNAAEQLAEQFAMNFAGLAARLREEAAAARAGITTGPKPFPTFTPGAGMGLEDGDTPDKFILALESRAIAALESFREGARALLEFRPEVVGPSVLPGTAASRVARAFVETDERAERMQRPGARLSEALVTIPLRDLEVKVPAIAAVGEAMNDAAAVAVSAFGAMAQAAIEGSRITAGSIINMVARIAQSIPGVGSLAGAFIGAAGGLFGALFGGGRQRQPVLVQDDRSRDEINRLRRELREAEQRRQQRITVQILDARGNPTSSRDFLARVQRDAALGAVPLLPAGLG